MEKQRRAHTQSFKIPWCGNLSKRRERFVGDSWACQRSALKPSSLQSWKKEESPEIKESLTTKKNIKSWKGSCCRKREDKTWRQYILEHVCLQPNKWAKNKDLFLTHFFVSFLFPLFRKKHHKIPWSKVKKIASTFLSFLTKWNTHFYYYSQSYAVSRASVHFYLALMTMIRRK